MIVFDEMTSATRRRSLILRGVFRNFWWDRGMSMWNVDGRVLREALE
jgi:hypothetical protein